RIQRVDELLAEARHAVAHLVATDDAVREPGLIGLVDDAAVALEILRAARDELIQRLLVLLAVAQRVAYTNTRPGRARVDRFHFPNTDAAVAPVLLQHPRPAFGQALRQLAVELLQRRIKARVGAPAHLPRPIEHFLRAHLQNQIRMRAHEHAVARHVAQE